LWFKDTGGSGQVVILLHANTGTSANWERQFTAFSQAGFRVIAFDRRGWGKSIANPGTGPQPGSVAEDLHGLAEYLKLNRFSLVGVAGGGFVALDYAAWHPERLINMVVAASAGSIQDKEIRDFDARIMMPGFTSLPMQYREVGASYRGANPSGTAEWINIEEHAQQPGSPSQPMRNPNTYAKLEKINVRTLVMPGDADLIAPPSLMKLWGSHLPNAEWISVPDAGHSIAWEQPEIFNSYVLQFLKGCRGRSIRDTGGEMKSSGCDIH
jgi:pimeloyl-ACP methyl ester carboxylesterase